MQSAQVPTKRKSRSISSFLKKTYEMVQNHLDFNVVRWASNGIGFVILQQQAFTKQVLPRYFKHSNYSSFVRQLNMYNFHKIRENNSQSYFHHQFFVKEKRQLLNQIKRKRQTKERKTKRINGKFEQQRYIGDDFSQKQDILKRERFKKQARRLQIKDKNQQFRNFESTHSNLKSSSQNVEAKSQIMNRRQLKTQWSNQKLKSQNLLQQKNRIQSNQQDYRKGIASSVLISNDDDELSINKQVRGLFPKHQYQENQMFYPSNKNIYPFPTNLKGSHIISQFNILF